MKRILSFLATSFLILVPIVVLSFYVIKDKQANAALTTSLYYRMSFTPVDITQNKTIELTLINGSRTEQTGYHTLFYVNSAGNKQVIYSGGQIVLARNEERSYTHIIPKKYFSYNVPIKLMAVFSTGASGSGNSLHSVSFLLKDRDLDQNGESKIIRPEKLARSTYTGKGNYSTFESYSLNSQVFYGDSFTFSHTTGNYISDYFYKIDLSFFQLIYTNAYLGTKGFTYDSVYFELENDRDVFPLLQNEVIDGYIRIPCTISRRNDFVYFTPTSDLCVNPETLQMSLKYEIGFEKTHDFYFPKDSYDSDKEFNFRLVINNVTYNSYTIIYSFTYCPNLSLIGDCVGSKFCIGTTLENGE